MIETLRKSGRPLTCVSQQEVSCSSVRQMDPAPATSRRRACRGGGRRGWGWGWRGNRAAAPFAVLGGSFLLLLRPPRLLCLFCLLSPLLFILPAAAIPRFLPPATLRGPSPGRLVLVQQRGISLSRPAAAALPAVGNAARTRERHAVLDERLPSTRNAAPAISLREKFGRKPQRQEPAESKRRKGAHSPLARSRRSDALKDLHRARRASDVGRQRPLPSTCRSR